MISGDILYWLGWIGVIAFYCAMIYLAWWALFSDRHKGRRRCPKCWYDMCGTPGMTCNECGHTVHFEKQLTKRRRRPLFALLSFVSCVAIAGYISESLVDQGWLNLAPTKALILSLPFTMDINGSTYKELVRRMQADELSDREWRMVMKRCAEGDWERRPLSDAWLQSYAQVIAAWRGALESGSKAEEPLLDLEPVVNITTRDSWPADVSPRLEVTLQDWWPSGMETRVRAQPRIEGEPATTFYKTNAFFRQPAYQLPIPPLTQENSQVVIDLTIDRRRTAEEGADWESVGTYTVTVPLVRKGRLDDLLEPVQGSAVDQVMRQALSGQVTKWDKGRSPVRVNIQARQTNTDVFQGIAVGAIIELLCDGQVARRLDIWWPAGARGIDWEVVYEDEPLLRTASGRNGTWQMRVRGDAELALRVPGATKYWAGQFTIPMKVRRARQSEAPPRPWWTDDDDAVAVNPDAPADG